MSNTKALSAYLTKAQAFALRDAMCAANNVGAQIEFRIPRAVYAAEYHDGSVFLSKLAGSEFTGRGTNFKNQSEFLAAIEQEFGQ